MNGIPNIAGWRGSKSIKSGEKIKTVRNYPL